MRCRWSRRSAAYGGPACVRMVLYINYFYYLFLGTAGCWERIFLQEESGECRRRRSLLVAPGGSTARYILDDGVD